MTPELKELYRYTIEQKDREIEQLKARVSALEKQLLERIGRTEGARVDQIIISQAPPTVTT